MLSPLRLVVRTFFFTTIVALFTTHFKLITQMQNNVRLEGEAGFPRNTPTKRNTTRIVQRPFVDVLSISSLARPEVAMAQKNTWASHRNVRHFFTITENDDPDPYCNENFTAAERTEYVRTCHSKIAWSVYSKLTTHFNTQFARREWLDKKKDPGAWICAQRRMAAGVAKVGRAYRHVTADQLPDFLMVVDDDTYVNMDLFEKEVLRSSNKTEIEKGEVIDSETDTSAKVYVGCLVVSNPAKRIQFTSPFGGWGTFFSRGAIERLIKPLHCGSGTNKNNEIKTPSPFEEGACRRLTSFDDYTIGELVFYNEGMSISDLMGAVASSTTTPYCMHSDWSMGYFINFYNISGVRWVGPETRGNYWYPQVAQTRMHPLGKGQNSYIYERPGGECQWTGENCHAGSLVCHYVNSTQMTRLWRNRNDIRKSDVLPLVPSLQIVQ